MGENPTPARRPARALARWPAVFVLLGAGLALGGQSGCDHIIGRWEPVQTLAYRPVHSTLLPTGKVWWWSTDNARTWDPATGTVANAAPAGYDIFCSGHSLTADGKVFVTGGNTGACRGLPNASFYDPVSNTWTPLANMNAGRWYPTNVTLGNGDVVVMSGHDINAVPNNIAQVWQVGSGSWRTLSGAPLNLVNYPAAFLAPNGRVFVATATSRYLDTAGTGSWTTVATRQVAGRDNFGSACMYDDGKVIYTGGGDPPQSSCEVIDLNAATPAWTPVAPMPGTGGQPQPRRQHNVTILPDGTLLVTGGSSSGGFDTNDGPKPALNWDPATNQWTIWAMEARYRGYHSEAVLLPDGRVASIGGDNQSSLQVFSPPYLFKGPRPTVRSAPATVGYGQTFFVGTPEATDIRKVHWIRLTSVTHTKNMNQRINRLTFAPAEGGLNVTAPANGNLCPPGHYLLFLLTDRGVPSVGRFIRIS